MTTNTASANEILYENWRNYLLLAKKGLLHMDQLIGKCNELMSKGDTENALLMCKTYIQHTTGNDKDLALFNYGSMLQSTGNYSDAEVAYKECLEISNRLPQARINLGLLYERNGDLLGALQQWQTVIEKRDATSLNVNNYTLALNHIGRVYENKKLYELAEQALEESLCMNPKQPGVIQHWVHIRQKACAWPVYKKLPGISQNQMIMATSPLAMLALTDDPIQQLLTAYAFVERTYGFKEEFLNNNRQYQHERLRIGYVSGDLCVHAVGLILAELIEGHDRNKCEIYGYDFSPEDGTTHRKRLKDSFDHLRSIHQLNDRQAAELILSDEIDILIDLHGLSSGARPGIFALHPAPKQGTYLGFIGTTGMPWFDFVITDKYVITDELVKYFTEKPLYLNCSFLPRSINSNQTNSIVRAEYNLPDRAFVMAAFGNTYKITQEMFSTWIEILRAIPSSILWLIDDNKEATENLKKYAQSKNIKLEKIIFTPRCGYDEYRKKIQLADIFLDNFPYNCGSTTADVLNAGIPFVSLSGNSMVSRMGGSILNSLNCQELIAKTHKQYVKICKRLHDDQDWRIELKSKIKASSNSEHSKKIAREIENQLKEKND